MFVSMRTGGPGTYLSYTHTSFPRCDARFNDKVTKAQRG